MIAKFLGYLFFYAQSFFFTLKYWLASKFLTSKIYDINSSFDVSLTSHGKRLNNVYLTIESIAANKIKARNIYLWVDDREFFDNPTIEVVRLIKRGLLFKFTENLGPHTKYYPYLFTSSNPIDLVTADDDILYPTYWLNKLVLCHSKNPDDIICFRAHRLNISSDKLIPYNEWKPCLTTDASFLNFATGVSGVYYPSKFLNFLKIEGDGFKLNCPKADDVWLHFCAVKYDFKIRQITTHPIHFPYIINSQSSGLRHHNVNNEHNDNQIRKTYTSPIITKLNDCGV